MAKDSAASPATGSCLCGAVRYTITGPLRPILVCHCAMCRRAMSSVAAFTACAPGDIHIEGTKLRWYQSSPIARRGFCAQCGSSLFWEPAHGGHLSVSAGSLDDPSKLTISEHIFLAEDTSPMRALAPADAG